MSTFYLHPLVVNIKYYMVLSNMLLTVKKKKCKKNLLVYIGNKLDGA